MTTKNLDPDIKNAIVGLLSYIILMILLAPASTALAPAMLPKLWQIDPKEAERITQGLISFSFIPLFLGVMILRLSPTERSTFIHVGFTLLCIPNVWKIVDFTEQGIEAEKKAKIAQIQKTEDDKAPGSATETAFPTPKIP